MKKFTKFASLLTAAALLAFLPDSNVLTVAADAPKTYAISYVEKEEEWCFQELTSSEEDEDDFDDFDKLEKVIKDGDSVVIYGGSDDSQIFRIPARLNSLTIMGGDEAIIVYTEGIQEAYITYGALAAINGNIEKAYVYDDAEVSFINNVTYLEIISDEDALVTCAGTVGHAISHYDGEVEFEVYNVAADKFRVEDADIETDKEYYSTTPVSTPAPSAPQAGSSSASDEYDDVPKTGESSAVYLLLAAAAVFFAGSRALKRA